MTTKAKKKTATKAEVQEMADATGFNPNDIMVSITGSVTKNTLPAIRAGWASWLSGYEVAEFETDKDFASAAEFVKDCKLVEDKIGEIKEKAMKGEVFNVLKELDEMREATRQKRLEFSRAVDERKNRLKSDAITAALKKVNDHLAALPYRWTAVDGVDIEGRLRTAIKGLSAILKMDDALQTEAGKLMTEATEYSVQYLRNRGTVADIYRTAGETGTDSELDALVRTYGDAAPERARFIIEQKKVARQQEELNRQKAATAQPQVETPPPAAPYPDTPTARTYRVGATFRGTIEQISAAIERIGGSDVKFIEK